jgi:hypothetical protein
LFENPSKDFAVSIRNLFGGRFRNAPIFFRVHAHNDHIQRKQQFCMNQISSFFRSNIELSLDTQVFGRPSKEGLVGINQQNTVI